jgi:hypothetical protein
MTLAFGFFRAFKGDDTLLIWGDDDFDKLRDSFGHLADSPMDSLSFEDTGYLKPAGPCSVTVSCTGTKPGGLTVTIQNFSVIVTCGLTQNQLRDFSGKIGYLASNKDVVAHQYLDIQSPQPFQIIVSRGEYPKDLDPDE